MSEKELQPRIFHRREFLRTLAGAAILLEACSFDKKEHFESNPTWEQDFSKMSSGPLSIQEWTFEEGDRAARANKQEQLYTAAEKNARIEKGLLVIEAHHEETGSEYEYTSARISTKDKFTFTRGKLEVDARLPNGTGTWAAIWALPNNNKYSSDNNTGLQNYLMGGELDIMEYVGMDPNTVYSSSHTYKNDVVRKIRGTKSHQVPDCTENFHTYGMEWLEDSITYTIDGNPVGGIKKVSNNPGDWPFDQPYYLIMNLAMGGTWGGKEKEAYPPDGIDNSHDSWRFEAKAIRYYPLKRTI